MAANPLDSIGLGGPHEDEDSIRRARRARALPEMASYLADAADQFAGCEADCLYLASGIDRGLERSPSTTKQASHKLSSTQYEALRALAKVGTTMQTRDRDSAIVLTPDHTLITTATLQSLDKRGLVHLDTSAPLYQGRGITVTAEGHRALAQHRARTSATTVPTTTPTVAAKREGRR
ncbi:hypothetical protein ACWC9R_12195 [Streptomyces sp. NPDC001219]